MQRPVGFSSGDIYTWTASINEQINILRQLPCNAIEINYAAVHDLDQEITADNIEYLHSLDYVSIHAPFYGDTHNDLSYANNGITGKILQKVKEQYDRLGAKAAVFHPNLIGDYRIFSNLGFNACLENMPSARGISTDEFITLAGEHPELGVVIDTAHALSWDEQALGMLIGRLGKRTSHIHFSDRRYSPRKGAVSDHRQLLYAEDMGKFEAAKRISCPVILEVSVKDKKNDIQNLIMEYEFARGFLEGK